MCVLGAYNGGSNMVVLGAHNGGSNMGVLGAHNGGSNTGVLGAHMGRFFITGRFRYKVVLVVGDPIWMLLGNVTGHPKI